MCVMVMKLVLKAAGLVIRCAVSSIQSSFLHLLLSAVVFQLQSLIYLYWWQPGVGNAPTSLSQWLCALLLHSEPLLTVTYCNLSTPELSALTFATHQTPFSSMHYIICMPDFSSPSPCCHPQTWPVFCVTFISLLHPLFSYYFLPHLCHSPLLHPSRPLVSPSFQWQAAGRCT